MLVAAVIAFAGVVAAAQAQEPVAVPGTQVAMPAPEGFTVSERFAGFENASTGASILIVEMPAEAFPQLLEGLTAEGLAQRGLTEESRSEETIGGLPALLIGGTQAAGGLTLEKRMLILGGEVTALLTATIPPDVATPEHLAEVEASLRAVRLTGEPGDAREALPFAFDEVAGFRFDRALGGSGALLVEEQPAETASRPAVFIIANSLGASCSQFVGREEAFGRAILGQISDFTIDEIASNRDVVIGGLSGVEHVANGTSENGAPTTVIQTVLFDGCNYLRSVGMAPQGEGQPYLPRFRRLAETIRTK